MEAAKCAVNLVAVEACTPYLEGHSSLILSDIGGIAPQLLALQPMFTTAKTPGDNLWRKRRRDDLA